MATKRIKDISTTATTFAADDFIALDASSVGTRKMAKASLITQVGANYLEKADNLSDVASKDTSKLNLEVPNVGTAANEVPVNGMLGDLAFQSSDGPSVSNLNVSGTTTLTNDSDIALAVETNNQNAMTVNVIGTSPNYIFDVRDDGTSKFRIDSSGRVGVGTGSVTTGFNLEVVSGDMRVADAAGADACELGYSAGAGKSFVQSYNRNTSAFSDLVLNNVATLTASGRLIIANIPTSASGLASGTVWSDSGTLKIVS